MIAGLTGIAGSSDVGDGVVIAGGVGIADHRTIGSRATLGAGAGDSGRSGGRGWLGYPAGPRLATLREWASLRKLPEFLHRSSRTAGPATVAAPSSRYRFGLTRWFQRTMNA